MIFSKLSRRIAPNILFSALLFPVIAFAQVDVLTQHNNNARSGANLSERVLTPASVNKQHFGMLFKRVVDDQLYTQPLLITKVRIGGGWHDVVYVTTVNNSVYAFDANDATALAPFWHVNFGTPANLHDADFGCLDINGNMGIIGTPVINAEKNTLYVVSLAKANGKFVQRLHALDPATGADLPNSRKLLRHRASILSYKINVLRFFLPGATFISDTPRIATRSRTTGTCSAMTQPPWLTSASSILPQAATEQVFGSLDKHLL